MAVVAAPQRRSLSMRARKVRTIIGLAVIITAVTQAPQFISGAHASNEKVNPGQITYVSVRSGDTLWSLAKRYAPSQDTFNWIDTVTTMNSLGSTSLYAGERIAIPSN